MAELRTFEVDVMTEGQWNFRDSGPYWGGTTYDPFPCYGHSVSVTSELLERVARRWEPSIDVTFWLVNREEPGRSNGWSQLNQSNGDWEWCEEHEKKEWRKTADTGSVVFQGKRIPPMNAMTRHLVGHEYGHHVEWMIAQERFGEYYDTPLMQEYALVRGLDWEEHKHHGNGGRWHSSIHEIFACDFRILIAGLEIDHWPHPGVRHPGRHGTLHAWWEEVDKWWRTRAAD